MDTAARLLVIPEVTYSLLAILALLLVWQYHNNLSLAGRIYAVDFWDVSGIRMFLHVTTWDGQACEVCQEANGTAFLPSLSTVKGFSTLPRPCANAGGCRCLIVALYGGWPEANRVLQRLRKYGRKNALTLTEQEFVELLEGPWERSVTAAGDQLTMNIIEAMRVEGQVAEDAAFKYRYIIDRARGARNLRLLVPAFLRLSKVLERLGHHEDAIALCEQFEQRFSRNRRGFYYPSEEQRGTMAMTKIRLQTNLKLKMASTNAGPSISQPSQSSSVSV